MQFFLLYIDPGTGSALFTIVIGVAAVAYFLVRGIWLKLGILFFRKQEDDNKQAKYVIYAEDKRYWGVFEPILDQFEDRKIQLLYLTTSSDDPVFSSNYKFITGKFIGTGNRAYAYLNFLTAEFLLTTTPQLDVLQWKKSKRVLHYCHYIHAAGGPSLYRRYALDYFDSVLIPSYSDIQEIRDLESIRNTKEKILHVVGNTYFDRCIKKIKKIEESSSEKSHDFSILVSPSWGPSALLSVYGEKLLDPLIKTGWNIIVRPHPQSLISEKTMVDNLINRYRDMKNVEWDYNHENIPTLIRSDLMISDFSGIIYDYVFLLNRPVIVNIKDLDFRRLDAYDLKDKPFYYNSFKKVGYELDSAKLGSIKDVINKIINDKELDNKRLEIKNTMWAYQGQAAKRVADFMIQACQ